MSDASRSSRPKKPGGARRGGPTRAGAGGGKRAGSTGQGKGSFRGGKSAGSAGRGGKQGGSASRGGNGGGSASHGGKGGSSGGYGKSSFRGAKSTGGRRDGDQSRGDRFDKKSRSRANGTRDAERAGSGRRSSSSGGADRYAGRGDRKTSGQRSSTGRGRDAKAGWDRPRRTDPASQQRTQQGPDRRAGGPVHRGPRDPLIEEIRTSTPKAKQEAAIAAFEHARELLQRGRDGAAAEAAADAKRLAPRSGAVRELYGVALYRSGRYRDALRELQAYRRMTGRLDQNHLIADSYRGLGMPDKAVPVAVEAVRSRLREEPRAEAAIVGASALADLGRYDEALGLLRGFPGRRDEAEPWELRVWYVAGDVLERSGRKSEAAEEFRRVVRYDAGAFDAAERLAALTG
jgi:hypothetical protein